MDSSVRSVPGVFDGLLQNHAFPYEVQLVQQIDGLYIAYLL
jgi:hypothetical protein